MYGRPSNLPQNKYIFIFILQLKASIFNRLHKKVEVLNWTVFFFMFVISLLSTGWTDFDIFFYAFRVVPFKFVQDPMMESWKSQNYWKVLRAHVMICTSEVTYWRFHFIVCHKQLIRKNKNSFAKKYNRLLKKLLKTVNLSKQKSPTSEIKVLSQFFSSRLFMKRSALTSKNQLLLNHRFLIITSTASQSVFSSICYRFSRIRTDGNNNSTS